MSRRQAARQPDADLEHAPPRHRALELIERAPRHVLGDQERPALDIADPERQHDVGVEQPGERAALEQEALSPTVIGRRAGDELDRHRAVEQQIVAEVDQAHATGAERPQQPVSVEAGRRDPTSLLPYAFPRRHRRDVIRRPPVAARRASPSRRAISDEVPSVPSSGAPPVRYGCTAGTPRAVALARAQRRSLAPPLQSWAQTTRRPLTFRGTDHVRSGIRATGSPPATLFGAAFGRRMASCQRLALGHRRPKTIDMTASARAA